MKYNLQDITDKTIVALLSIFIIGFFNENIEAIKNIAIVAAFLLFLYKIIAYPHEVLTNYKLTYTRNRTLIIFILTFLIFTVISSSFAYYNSYLALHSFFKEIKKIILFSIILLSIKNKKTEFTVKTFLLCSALSILIGNLHFFYKAYENFHSIDKNFMIDRNYSQYFEMVYPFALTYILTSKGLFSKILLSTVVLLGLILVFYTGARGSWLAIFVETLIIMFLYSRLIRLPFKKTFKHFISFIAILFISLLLIYENSNIVRHKINQGLNSSGRDIILKDRLPVFINSNRVLLGLGYGTRQYEQFLRDNNVPKRIGKYRGNLFIYYHDEPTFIGIFYEDGIVGAAIFIILVILSIYSLIKNILEKKDYINITIFASLIGVFFIRGLFEGLHLKYFLFLIVLFLFINRSYENSIHIP